MPWKGVTVSETRGRFIENWKLNYYSVTELAERFEITPKTAHKWIGRYEKYGESGYHEHSRRPHSCPWQTDPAMVEELLAVRQAHPHWGPRKLLNLMDERKPGRELPAPSTAALILARHGLVRTRRRHRRAHPGAPQTVPHEPNDTWAADYKGQFRLRNGDYCFPLTVSDLASRYVLAVDAHPRVSLERTQAQFLRLFEAYGLPGRIRTDNGVPFASNALARLSQLSAWWIKLGIYPELIEPGEPQQNGVHERMHRTLKREATIPPESSLRAQQRRFDRFREEFNRDRPHEGIGMRRPAQAYEASRRVMPKRLDAYEYPGHYLVRRVSRCGTIRVFKNQVFVSNTLQEDQVGLEEVADGVYDLYYCFYQIARYELRANKIHDIVSRVPVSYPRVDLASRV